MYTLHLLGDLYTVECDNIHKKIVVKRSSKDHLFKMVIVMTVIYFSALLTQFLNYKPKKVQSRISTYKINLINVKAYFNNPELIEADEKANMKFIGQIFQKMVL